MMEWERKRTIAGRGKGLKLSIMLLVCINLHQNDCYDIYRWVVMLHFFVIVIFSYL